jgi:hypothetical protein
MINSNGRVASMTHDELETHVFSTYITLRYGMAVLAFAFPIILYFVGRIHNIPLQDSMSAYYHALPPNGIPFIDLFAPRSFFVGLLFAIGAFLYLYKGFSSLENMLLNVAGVCAWGVALYPIPWACDPTCPKITPHYIFAVVLFVCIGAVSIYCTRQTLHLLKDERTRRQYVRLYNTLGAAMLASPVAAIVVSFALGEFKKHIFFIEAAGVWAFAAYWWVKSRELAITEAEKLALSRRGLET